MFQYSKIYRISSLNNKLREEYIEEDEKMIDGKVVELFNEIITIEDYQNLNACLVNNSVYIRDDGRKALRLFNILNEYYHAIMEEVSYDIIMENSYIKEEFIDSPDDESKYDMEKWREFEEYPKKMFRKFRLDMTSTDDVLDKIVDKGMDYLDDIDKEVLETKKPS